MPGTTNRFTASIEDTSFDVGQTQTAASRTVRIIDTVETEASDVRAGARANAADHHVGARIRERRVMLGLSQQQLAAMIGVTYQQAHKYERGLNRISAGRLYEIAQVLTVPVSWFFDGLAMGDEVAQMTPRQRMCLELARNFAAIDNERHQEALSQMARALAQNGA